MSETPARCSPGSCDRSDSQWPEVGAVPRGTGKFQRSQAATPARAYWCGGRNALGSVTPGTIPVSTMFNIADAMKRRRAARSRKPKLRRGIS